MWWSTISIFPTFRIGIFLSILKTLRGRLSFSAHYLSLHPIWDLKTVFRAAPYEVRSFGQYTLSPAIDRTSGCTDPPPYSEDTSIGGPSKMCTHRKIFDFPSSQKTRAGNPQRSSTSHARYRSQPQDIEDFAFSTPPVVQPLRVARGRQNRYPEVRDYPIPAYPGSEVQGRSPGGVCGLTVFPTQQNRELCPPRQ